MQRYCSFTDYVYTFLLLQLSPKYLTTYNRTFVLQILLSMASLKCFLHSISKLIMVGREALVCTCCSVGWDGLRTAAQWLNPGVQLRAVCLSDFFRNKVVSCLLKFCKSICGSGAVMTAGAEPLRVFCPLGFSKMWNGPNFHQVTNIFPVCRYEHCLSAVCRSTLNRGSFTFSLDHLR